MAILRREVTNNTVLTSGYGTLELTIPSGDKVKVDLSEIPSDGFALPNTTGLSGELLGSSYAVTAASGEVPASTTILYPGLQAGVAITLHGGVGKATISVMGRTAFVALDEAGQANADKITIDLANISGGLVVPAGHALIIEDGAVAFAASGGTGSYVLEGGTPVSADQVLGGHGQAVITLPAGGGRPVQEKVVKLNELSYPFTLLAAESMRPLGNSFIVI